MVALLGKGPKHSFTEFIELTMTKSAVNQLLDLLASSEVGSALSG